jgi:transposase-like protein
MDWSARDARRDIWAERLRRFSESGLTVAAFCQREGVSAPSFYQWRRKLDGERGRRTRQTQKNARRSPAFVPVHITGNPRGAVRPRRIEIRLPNGVQVWLPGDDPEVLAAGIAVAAKLAASDREPKTC